MTDFFHSEERFLKGEAVNSNMYGPLRDGADFTIVSSKTGEIPENPPLSSRKQEQVYKSYFLVGFKCELFVSHKTEHA